MENPTEFKFVCINGAKFLKLGGQIKIK